MASPRCSPLIAPHPEGAVLAVRAVPRSARRGLLGIEEPPGGQPAVRWGLAAAPVDGAANDELSRSIARHLGVASGAVCILRGERSRIKHLLVAGLTAEEVQARLKEKERS